MMKIAACSIVVQEVKGIPAKFGGIGYDRVPLQELWSEAQR